MALRVVEFGNEVDYPDATNWELEGDALNIFDRNGKVKTFAIGSWESVEFADGQIPA